MSESGAHKKDGNYLHCLLCGREFRTKIKKDGSYRTLCRKCSRNWPKHIREMRASKQPSTLYCLTCGEPFSTKSLTRVLCDQCQQNTLDDFKYAKHLAGRVIIPLWGYKYVDKYGKEILIPADDIAAVRGLCLHSCDNSKFPKGIMRSSLREMIQQLRKDGWRILWESQVKETILNE